MSWSKNYALKRRSEPKRFVTPVECDRYGCATGGNNQGFRMKGRGTLMRAYYDGSTIIFRECLSHSVCLTMIRSGVLCNPCAWGNECKG